MIQYNNFVSLRNSLQDTGLKPYISMNKLYSLKPSIYTNILVCVHVRAKSGKRAVVYMCVRDIFMYMCIYMDTPHRLRSPMPQVEGTVVLIIMISFRNCRFQSGIYLISHASAEALSTGRMIPSGTYSLPAEVSTQ